ncbi:sugar ABC transporter substrate-binding protein [Brachybacterium sp. EE-P12]|uniref:Sugar ABC transporter substrate-binding protein n=1 Tax=Candidatus Brachybacterium intestinipullorum TaxID=2838512 RepID=A0A9D2Q286_9MICO|nr:sugar ABC transporter substrate-binding protein [Brachybacterium sp. EE-P12]HJC70624.1 sugar ABC transporter substrate-binding protein [Candidatus Brachybacterium intestinipullorum]
MLRSLKKMAVGAAALALVLTACGTGGQAPEEAAGNGDAAAGASRDLDYAVIIHGVPDGSFWNVVKKGAEDGGAQYGVDVEVTGDPEGSRQAQLIDSAVANQPDGIVVSMANPDALQGSIEAARDAGIPVITINSGEDRSAEFGALAHFGQSEGVAGEGVGERLKEEGAEKVVCLIHEAGNVGLEQRCQGVADGFGGEVQNLQVDLNNPQGIQATVKSTLMGDDSIDTVVGLNPSVTTAALAGVEETGEEIKVASFDIDADVLAGIQDGTILFTVDQQQYLQGYLPIAMLVLYHDNGNTLGGGHPVLTGPAFVDSENVDQVAEFVQAGTR